MIKYSDVIKLSKSFKVMAREVQSEMLAHCYMVISDDKETLYNYMSIMSQLIYCETNSACGKCSECARIETNNHANITTLKSLETIKVDDIKELVSNTYLTALESGVKLYIIADGEKMNESSQNKLLKTLEEPTKNVVIIIGTTNENSMLQTIKSRCKKINLSVWNASTITIELSKISSDTDKIDTAILFSSGSISRAITVLTDDDFAVKHKHIISVLTDFKGSSNLSKFQNIFGTDKEQVLAHLNVFEGVISALTSSIISGQDTPLSYLYNVEILANIYYKIIDAYKRINSNCNISNVVYNLLLQIAEIKYKLA